MIKETKSVKRMSRVLISRLTTLAAITFIFGTILGAQNTGPQLHVAHPWDPASPIAPPSVTTSQAALPLSSTTWTALGPAPISNGQRPGSGPVSGRITGIAADPTDANTIYVAAAGGGVWKTTDGGTTWTPLTDTQATLSMGDIAIAPSNHLVLYAGTGEANNSGDSNFGRGILVSVDAGSTWTLTTGPSGVFNTNRLSTAQIAVDPTNAAIAYAAMADFPANGIYGTNTGVWKTTNSGGTWTNTTAAVALNSSDPWSAVVIDPNNAQIIYAALGRYDGIAANGVYKSTNGGATWNLLANGPTGIAAGRIAIAVSKSNSQVVYVTASGTGQTGSTAFGSLYKFVRSDDGGATFNNTLTAGTPNYLGGQGWYDTTVAVDPTNSAIVYVGGAAGSNSILRSTTSGASWTDINTGPSGGPHVDHHAAGFDAVGRYLDGDDGGLYRLDNPTTITWTQLNGNLSTIQFQGIGLHPTDPNIMLAGSQDNGTSKYTGSLSWTLVEGGDGGMVKFSKTNVLRVYHQAPVGSFGSANFFRRSDDGGTTWFGKVTGITDNTTNTQNFYAPFVVDPGNGNRLLYGAVHVWESTNGGDSWTPLGAAFANNVDAIGLSPSDSNSIYASAGGSTFFTNNHGATWTPHNLPVAGRVSDIEVSATDSLTAYAVISRFTTGGNVYRTIDGGVSWTNITGNLPVGPVWSLQIDTGVPGTLYAGTETGVYRTTNSGTTWSRFGAGFPDAQVFQIELNSTLRLLGAGTHGRGAWEILVPPVLSISKSHIGTFRRGQVGATYTVTVGNAGTGPTSGMVTVTDAPPTGLTITGLTGAGWTCTLGTLSCQRSDVLLPGANHPSISVTVTVAGNAPSIVTNSATASGGGDSSPHTATDLTIIEPPPHDFNGDGTSDLLFRNTTTGDVSFWLMNGVTIQQGQVVYPGLSALWQIAGKGDLNGDGKADLVFRNTQTGDVSGWLMNGAAINQMAVIYPALPSVWQIAGVGDLDGDGKADLVFRNTTTGDVSGWLMNGLTINQALVIYSALPSAWQISGVGDLDADGKTDLVFRNTTTGDVSGWLMNGLAIKQAGVVFPGLASQWQISRVGDLDANGKADLVFRNTTTGDVSAWLMNGLVVSQAAVVMPAVPLAWTIADIGDLDADGKTDLVFRNTTTGDVSAWLMNGLAIKQSSVFYTGLPSVWQIQ